MVDVYEERPPRVEAVQWDGTVEGTAPIVALLNQADGGCGWAVCHVSFDQNGSPYRFSITIERGYLKRHEKEILKGDFLVLHSTGQIEIVHKEDMDVRYRLHQVEPN